MCPFTSYPSSRRRVRCILRFRAETDPGHSVSGLWDFCSVTSSPGPLRRRNYGVRSRGFQEVVVGLTGGGSRRDFRPALPSAAFPGRLPATSSTSLVRDAAPGRNPSGAGSGSVSRGCAPLRASPRGHSVGLGPRGHRDRGRALKEDGCTVFSQGQCKEEEERGAWTQRGNRGRWGSFQSAALCSRLTETSSFF